MSLFQLLARTLRPTSSSATSTFRAIRSTHSPRLDPNFFGSSQRVGLGRRMYRTYHDFNKTNNMRLIYGICGLNIGIFLYGNYTEVQARQGHPGPFISYIQNMTLSLNGFIREHRYWTAVTSLFAHSNFLHIAGNVISFYYMGSLLARTPGISPLALAGILLGSGLSGSLGWMFLNLQRGGSEHRRALGFSGAVMGVGTIAAFLYPKTRVAIYGIIPMPLWLLMAGYAFYDGYYVNDQNSRIAHAGHLGGGAFGVAYYLLRLRGLRF
ncbi:hypothetical protein BU23DRAFT_533132 [Bimuria novae-zelandiae CBS 107.79]|uniref:Peptidase S54 rhomboid domain-containing protein n=1 Tax=Bimuria novae-zelandiae CBS 107.79 TaxID=1447943 RepID=A0A6A5VES9_9PLEO|nr:hypothetical protein BU23DRAFT_533132 [Bimuria novae-zelandiae CBS 107.79]